MYFVLSVALTIFLVFVSLAGVVIANVIVLYINGHTYGEIVQTYLTQFLARVAIDSQLLAEDMRSQFNDLPIPELRRAKDHTHPNSAADRSGASAFIDLLGPLFGRTPYFVQKSRADERNHREGSRTYYWTKDLTSSPGLFMPDDDSLLAFVDVDQYIDMPYLLLTQFKPAVIYTFQPHAVARSTGEFAFTFNAYDEVEYKVVGGGMYKHQVWNYGTDHLIIECRVYGVLLSVATFLVDRRKTSDDHEIILLTPLKKWLFPFCYLVNLEGRTLQRLKVVHGKFLRLTMHQAGGPTISTGLVGGYIEATIPASIDDMIASIGRMSKHDLTKPQVMSHVNGDDQKAVILVEYHRSGLATKPDYVFPVPDSIRRYQFEPKNFDPDAKPALVPFMSPIIHGCFAPDMCKSNEKQAVKGRVEDIRETTVPTSFLYKVMMEFAERLIPVPHQLDPVDYDVVWEKQGRPSQRHILEAASWSGPKYDQTIKSFVKKEAYANPNDPRLISPICGEDKLEYSRYTYAFTEILKETKWYAFGITPRQTAERVTTVCMHAEHKIFLGDFSRMDGHVSPAFRIFERVCSLRAFRRKYHKEFASLHESQYGRNAVTTHGVKYRTGTARQSGSPETACFNSAGDAVIIFTGLRMTKRNGRFLNANEAWDALGIYGGDDSMTADVDLATMQRAAKLWGQKISGDEILRGAVGVKFLARCYGPDVWFGDNNSCCDMKRQLAKFHATVCLQSNVTPAMKLLEKCRSFYLTDRKTPVIGQLVTGVMRAVGGMEYVEEKLKGVKDQLRPMRHWLADVDLADQYPNRRADWMVFLLRTQIPTFDLIRFVKWLENVVDNIVAKREALSANPQVAVDPIQYLLNSFLSPPLCAEPLPISLPKKAVVIDDEVMIPPEDSAPYAETKTEFDSMKKKPGLAPSGQNSKGRGRGRGGGHHVEARGGPKKPLPRAGRGAAVDTTSTVSTRPTS